ncbi:DUF3634 family protein [Salinisphaera sp. SPP-AMP-43]|uniref:DUF3634 family protein n=1 Tax=Salinisphaera sp. SPP-AMP-43 TaxID=3121288 RepID=UPI003C6E4FE9
MLDRFRLNYRLVIGPEGQLEIASGRAPQRFVAAVQDIVRLHGIERGAIECKGRGSKARLRFTAGFPERGRQAIRNVWQPPTTPGPGGGRRAAG